MKKAVILHGTLGSPEGNWYQWLETELLAKGFEVWVPTLPRADQPTLHEWAVYVHENRPFELDAQTLVVGHSSGAILALILAQRSHTRLGGIVGVSVFHDNSLNWEPNGQLFDLSLDFDAIRSHVDKLLFVHSDNDPYVPLDQAKFVADGCAAELVVLPGQGHFTTEQNENYQQFPELLTLLAERNLV